jgi:hypothetical protein
MPLEWAVMGVVQWWPGLPQYPAVPAFSLAGLGQLGMRLCSMHVFVNSITIYCSTIEECEGDGYFIREEAIL